jgi:hypothetical protein
MVAGREWKPAANVWEALLQSLCEERRGSLGRGIEAYQFTSCGGLLHTDTAIRVVRAGDEIVLTAHLEVLPQPDRRWTKRLTLSDWAALRLALHRARFWHRSEWKTKWVMLDGYYWTVEGLRGRRCHAAHGSRPEDGPVFESSVACFTGSPASRPGGRERGANSARQ